MDVRWATEHDIIRYYGEPQRLTRRAMVIVDNDEPIAIGSLLYQGSDRLMCLDIKPEAVKCKLTLWKASKKFTELFAQVKAPIYSVRDESIESSERYLTRLGFVPLENGVYQWLPQSPTSPR